MKVPFTKAHGAKNDFLLTWRKAAPTDDLAEAAIAICDRHTGIGADGWMLVSPADGPDADGAIELYNSDGSMAEISGNGTRCAAAFLMRHGCARHDVRVRTGAGVRHLRVLEHDGMHFSFEMNMGRPEIRDLCRKLEVPGGVCEATVVWVGNPQCAVPVRTFDFDWRAQGAALERHPEFPHRTNVSFVRPVDGHTIEVRFWERGAGETLSSGTGSTGAAAAAVAWGAVADPIEVRTPAGAMRIRVDGDYYLTGPAELTADGEFFY